MYPLILTRDEGDALRTFEGKHVVPLDSESGTYREWLVTIAREQYCIVDEAGTWTLLRYEPQCGMWETLALDVDTFLTTHRLILAA